MSLWTGITGQRRTRLLELARDQEELSRAEFAHEAAMIANEEEDMLAGASE